MQRTRDAKLLQRHNAQTFNNRQQLFETESENLCAVGIPTSQ